MPAQATTQPAGNQAAPGLPEGYVAPESRTLPKAEPVKPEPPAATAVAQGPTTVAAPQPVSLPVAAPLAAPVAVPSEAGWETGLQQEALALLSDGREDVWDVLSRRFETRLIQTALASTRGRRIEAAHKLGIGRNTITRKIQELGLE